MSKKENFNQAMFEMFGVGKGEAAQKAAGAEEMSTDAENVIQFHPNEEQTGLRVVEPPPVTYLARGTRIEGTLRAEGSVEIDGEFKGDIISEGSVTVRTDLTGNITARSLSVEGCCVTGNATISGQVVLNENSSVNGNINANSLTSSGTVMGDLNIQHNMMLDQKAKVIGDITTGTMTVARGAIIRGIVETRGEEF